MRLIFNEHSSTKWLQTSLKSNSGPNLIDAQIIYVPDDPAGMKYKVLYKMKDIENEKN